MRINSIRKLKLNNPIKMYDIVNAQPHHNFLIKVNQDEFSSSDDLTEVPYNGHNHIVSHNCGFLDEMDFASGSSPLEGQSKMMALYITIKRRIESRYMKLGKVPGIMFLVSSKRSTNDFLESYINSNKDTDKLLISDAPIWEVKNTPGRYSGETFSVALGNRLVPSKIITDKDDIESYKNLGLKILEVPVEHRTAFESDINAALRDIAGIALSSDIKYIDMDKYQESCRDYLSNPFTMNTITLDFDDEVEIEDYLIQSRLPESEKTKPHAIHWDPSLSGDTTGLAMVSAIGNSKVKRITNSGSSYSTYDVIYKLDFSIGIRPTQGKEIPFYKIRNFIYYLIFELGYNIVSISCDGFQSADTLQEFKRKTLPAHLISVDRNIHPYNMLKNTLNEGRLLQPYIEELELEYQDIYYDSVRNKVDHTTTGSKDRLDAVAGALFGLSSFREMSSEEYSHKDVSSLLDINKQLMSNSDNWLFGDNYTVYE